MCVSLDGKLSFRCFDGISALSVDCRCHLTAARGTGNFGQYITLSGNRCKFTSVLICTSLAHPCASVAGFQAKFQVPLTSLIRYPHSDERSSAFARHWQASFFMKFSLLAIAYNLSIGKRGTEGKCILSGNKMTFVISYEK